MSIQEDWLTQGGLPLSWWSVPQPVWARVSRSQIRTRSVADGATVRHEGSLVGTFWRLTSLAPMRAGGSLARSRSLSGLISFSVRDCRNTADGSDFMHGCEDRLAPPAVSNRLPVPR